MLNEDKIAKIFVEFPDRKIEKLLVYAQLLRDWNSKVNLVSRRDIDNVIVRHLIPCLTISRIANFSSGERVLDIGTGGGLPGIPLAIVFSDVHFTLIDSIGKKITAVNDMVERLQMCNVQTKNIRAEVFSENFDKIVARAVTNLKDFTKYSKKLLKNSGLIFYIKGGDCSEDFKLLKNYEVYRVSDVVEMPELADKMILKIFI